MLEKALVQTSGEPHQIQMLTPTLDFSGVTRAHKLLSTLPVNCNLAEMRYIWCTRYINSLVLLGSPFDDLNLHHALGLDWTVEVRTTQSVTTCWLCHKMKIPFCTQSCVISEFCKKNMNDTFDLNVVIFEMIPKAKVTRLKIVCTAVALLSWGRGRTNSFHLCSISPSSQKRWDLSCFL